MHELAGRPAPGEMLIDVEALKAAYTDITPDHTDPGQKVSFGTSGHRGSSMDGSFNEAHIIAISQAIAEYREAAGISGPLFLGMDTHALSEQARRTALEVFAAHQIAVHVDANLGFTPTPVVSHAIRTHNRSGQPQADGVVITPSHNPPRDGGFKYNPPHGGPADTGTTRQIEARANEILSSGTNNARRIPYERAVSSSTVTRYDFTTPYVDDLANVLDMDAIANAGLRIGADPMGGAGVGYWQPIAERYGLDLATVDTTVDPTFGFMTVDHDGLIRMDCSSPYAMARLIDLRDRFDIAFGNDPDFDRHGIVTSGAGLLNPNHYLAVAVDYLFGGARPDWSGAAAVGKTLVSSMMIDRVAADHGRRLAEVPVGFKWFVDGLLSGEYGFAGEESAGATFLRRDGTVWTTDKDGIIMALLAAEITARTNRDPGEHYARLESRFGSPVYRRIQAPATLEQKAKLKNLSADSVRAATLAGDPITGRLTRAPANDAPIGGLKVTSDHGWFAARPSGTEDIYKIYAESQRGEEHVERILSEAREIVDDALA